MMRVRWLLLLVGLEPMFLCGMPLTLEGLTHALPSNTQRMYVFYPSAAVCTDGSVWLVWTQQAKLGHLGLHPRISWTGDPEIGLFCCLVAPNGSVTLPATRIATAQMGREGIPSCPVSFFPVARRDSGVFVFVCEYGTGITRVISLGRDGKRDDESFSGQVWAARSRRGQPYAACFWAWTMESDGDNGFLFREEGSRWVQKGVLHESKGKIELISRGRYRPMEEKWDSLNSVLEDTSQSWHNRRLGWTINDWCYTAVTLLGRDTLLVATIPASPAQQHPWFVQEPGDTLVLYRLHESDLTVIDSTRAIAAGVSGAVLDKPSVFQALLQRTTGGYVFAVGAPQGTLTFFLDARGNPVLGSRTRGLPLPAASWKGAGRRSISVFEPDGYDMAHRWRWAGISSDGSVYSESYSQ